MFKVVQFDKKAQLVQRLNWAIALLLIAPVVSFLNFMVKNAPSQKSSETGWISRFVAPPSNDWGVLGETQFAHIRAFLPPRGTIGLVSDEADGMFSVRYYGAQASLAPLVVRPTAQATLVLCLFNNPLNLRDARQKRVLKSWVELDYLKPRFDGQSYTLQTRRIFSEQPLVLVRNFGNGVLLFRVPLIK